MTDDDSLPAALSLARGGELAAAAQMLGRIADADRGAVDACVLLAGVEQRRGAVDRERAALIEALNRSPRHLPALLARGGLERRVGDDRAAVRFYRTALAVAGQAAPAPQLAPAIEDGVARNRRHGLALPLAPR